MSSNLPRIDYYFDVVSPYSWIGFEILQKLEHQWKGVNIRYIPFCIRQVMVTSGNRPPAMLKSRSIMLMNDVVRTAKHWDVPLTVPKQFKKWILEYSTIPAQQLLLVLDEMDTNLMIKAAREMWMRLWSRNEKIFEDEDFMEVLKAIGVKNPEKLIEKSKEEKYERKLLDECTEEALKTHAYGAPWINVQTSDGKVHAFFGSDRFNLIAELLNQPQPVPDKFMNQSKL